MGDFADSAAYRLAKKNMEEQNFGPKFHETERNATVYQLAASSANKAIHVL